MIFGPKKSIRTMAAKRFQCYVIFLSVYNIMKCGLLRAVMWTVWSRLALEFSHNANNYTKNNSELEYYSIN